MSSAERTIATDRTASPIGLPSTEYIARIDVDVIGWSVAFATNRTVATGYGSRPVTGSASRHPSATSWMVIVYGPRMVGGSVMASPTTRGSGRSARPTTTSNAVSTTT